MKSELLNSLNSLHYQITLELTFDSISDATGPTYLYNSIEGQIRALADTCFVSCICVYIQKGPSKETYKRDLYKRPATQSYWSDLCAGRYVFRELHICIYTKRTRIRDL